MENIILCLGALLCLFIFWKITKIFMKIFFLAAMAGVIYFYFFQHTNILG